MAEDETKRDERTGDRDAEIELLAREMDITPEEARDLIRKHGNDRAALQEVAAEYRRRVEESGSDQATQRARSQSNQMNLGNTRSRNG